jgi:SAM-dependent methyltransferase
VLELGCGSGLYLAPLKKQRFDIHGLDISAPMLKHAKKIKGVRVFQKDMTTFKLPQKYDAILVLNSGLVLLPNAKAIQKTINNVQRHLNPGGLFLIDIPNHAVEIKENNNTTGKHAYKIPKGKLEVVFEDHKRGNKWVADWYGYVNGKKDFHEHYEELIVDPKTMERMFKGFNILSVHGTRSGGRFDPKKSYRRFYVLNLAN